MNPELFSTGSILPFIHKWTYREILNPDFKVGTLNPESFVV